MNKRILIVEDEKNIVDILSFNLSKEGYETLEAYDGEAGLQLALEQNPDLILLDLMLPKMNGFDVCRSLRRENRSTPVIMLTAYGDVELAVKALKSGAVDFILKPWDNEVLLEKIHAALQAVEREKVKQKTDRNRPDRPVEPAMIIGHSAVMMKLIKVVTKVAKTDANILITGENGTGKEMLAREIHRLSLRSRREMINVDMGAVSESLFESELFGHEKGAFTDARESRPGKFEAASGSTLFLDEIGNLPVGLQAKLLAALQNREVTRLGSNRKIPIDIRLIAATNRDLPELVKQSLFREDLYYRINTIQIEIPPLRNRREDIPLFIDYFLKKYTALYNQPGLTIHPQAATKLERYDWPGNIRELQHTIEKAVILAEKNVIRAADLFIRPGKSVSFSDAPNLGEVERKTIEAAITQNDGNLTAAAEQLGVSRQTLYNKLKRFNL